MEDRIRKVPVGDTIVWGEEWPKFLSFVKENGFIVEDGITDLTFLRRKHVRR